jgi:SAM-dependent methyltransferase
MPERPSISTRIISLEYQDFHRTSVDRFVADAAQGVPAGAVVVDAGAGEGMYKHLFSHAHYLALDYAVGDASWDYSRLDVVCDLHRVPLKTDSVPYLLCTQTLEHVPRPHIVVSELHRVLAPGGWLFCSMPFIADAHHQEPFDFFRYTRYAVSYLFESSGFSHVTVTPLGGYNTLLVSLVQKGLIRMVEVRRDRALIVRLAARFLQKVGFLLCRWANRLAWAFDQRDPDRYRFALGFTVAARK